MLLRSKLSRIALAVAMSSCIAGVTVAQETSSSLKGTVVGPQGNAAAGTVVTITHVPSGTVRRVTVNQSGYYSAQGLRVGGPYRVEFDSDSLQDKTVNDVYLTLGEPSNINLSLDTDSVERIAVTASSLSASEFGATSPASHFGITDLENAATASRDIKDIIRIDPRINIAESDGEEAIICGGSNPRFSSLTIDGVRMNDSFGLNNNGYPTTRMPFSFDAIDQVSVELAPFDVQYGGFTACNINAVTKSGNNEIHGSVFYDYHSDSMKGDKIEGTDIDVGDFTEKRYGFNVGVPILQDKLFLFTAYEKLEGAQIFQYDALGNQVSQAELQEIIDITRDVYGYDAGGMPASMPVEDEKLLMKLDWNISDAHRASLVYNYNDGFRLDQSDDRSNSVTLDSHFYEVGAKMNSWVGSLYSDWTENFSTEIRVGTISLDNRQTSLDQASGFGEIQIERVNGATVFLGPDDSRQTNDLDWSSQTFKVAGTYYMDNHTITGGFEYENLEIFNIFMQHTIGEYRFNGIEDYRNGAVDDIYYNNSAVTNNPLDAAAEFEYSTNTAYIQDKVELDDLTVLFGLRYDWYSSDDQPRFNEVFTNRYGFSNQSTFDGIDLLQPRAAFNYVVADNLELRGGIGLYSGGNPNVWLSNSYSNDGITNIDTYRGDTDLLDADGNIAVDVSGDGRLIYNPLQNMVDQVAANSPSLGDEPSVNAIDPNFEIPSEWKYNIGFTYETEDEYVIQGDILHSKKRDSALITALSWEGNPQFAADGRPLYNYLQVGERDDGRAITRSFRKSDLMLTNAAENGDSTTISIAIRKEFESGLTVNAGYAWNQSKDVTPMSSSVSFSNFTNFARTDAQNPGISTSNYETPHRLTFNLRYATEFFDGYKTTFSLFGSYQQGRPKSYAFTSTSVGATEFNSRIHLLYIPLENDPIVSYDPDFDLAAFNQFIEDEGLVRGEIQGRNAHNSEWYSRVDFRIDQELPAFYEGHKARASFVIQNLGNLLNDDWGIRKIGSFGANDVVEAGLNDDGTWTYENFFQNNVEDSPFLDQSLYEIRLGVRYTF